MVDICHQNITVRCRFVWKDTLRCLKKPFEFSNGFIVTFLGEEAVDEGGPLREYLRLLMFDLANNMGLFCGPENNRTAMHNVPALLKQDFVYVGKCIAFSILYNGPGPHFFCEAVADYLLDIPINIGMESIPDPEMYKKVKKVCYRLVNSL